MKTILIQVCELSSATRLAAVGAFESSQCWQRIDLGFDSKTLLFP